ncbi:hypothetical protein AALO_G00235440 [Alosa alosa]|uniref:Echinoderm microtubule-associated protein-like 4 n=1 Tax=Alosa alosa TaxID=278164 RepID=A0AAV6FW63_9TELE|nr:hypothetical protein AALO_G00235440 [Alosa alosa]
MDGFAGSLDDSISAASASDVQDRLSSLELRVQQQEDEITVMKAALADVLRRLALSEDSAAAAKKQAATGKGQNPLREAYSMSCIANGGSSVRKTHRDSTAVSVARKETLSSAAKSGTERKRDKPAMEGIKEKEEPPQANDKTPESKGPPPAKRGSSAKRGMERSQSSTWDSGEDSRNKLVKAASTSKLLAKVVKNAEK